MLKILILSSELPQNERLPAVNCVLWTKTYQIKWNFFEILKFRKGSKCPFCQCNDAIENAFYLRDVTAVVTSRLIIETTL